MAVRLGTLLLVLLLPIPALADGSFQGNPNQPQGQNSFNDPFSPFNPNSLAAMNREQQERMLEQQRQTWRDRFNERREMGWRQPPGTRFFARLFRRTETSAPTETTRHKWAADIFTRFRRAARVAFSTTTTGTSQSQFLDKVNRTALFENTGGFGKEVQRATPQTRFGYWDTAGGGGKGTLPLVKPERKVRQPGRWWSRPERRPDRTSGSLARPRGWRIHKAPPLRPQLRPVLRPPSWRVRKQ